MKISLLVFWGIFCSISAFNLENPNQPGVVWGDNSGGSQLVSIDENNVVSRVTVTRVTEVVGVITIIVNVNPALIDLFELVFETCPDDASQSCLTANLLDYETLIELSLPTIINVDVLEDGNINNKKSLSFTIVNLDDEKPTLTVVSCTMKENTSITVVESECIFDVKDRDGWLNLMNYSAIIGTKGEEELFEFKYQTTPADNDYAASVSLVLQAGQLLDYEVTTLYTFHIAAKDNGGNPTDPLDSIPVLVQVEDISDQPPRWDSSFQSAITIIEKKATTIQVSATDGDVGIDHKIIYEVNDPKNFVTIDENGLISVKEINRDEGNDQISFEVTAIEEEEPESFITGTVTLLVQDVDDNVAVLTVVGSSDKFINVTIDEGSSDIGVEISASDIDMGENAIYTAFLNVSEGANFASAISIIPGKGYETTTLSLTILNSALLDFENPDWQVITMELWTQGNKNPSMIDILPITITLKDLNDEPPIFAESEYTVTIDETVPIGTLVTTIQATDQDAEDKDGVQHELIGTLANNHFAIEEFGGAITTKIANAFDYEKQSEVIVQIKATDLNDHSATTQLTIQVKDVNDEKPRILVSSAIDIEENQIQDTPIVSVITASDDDSVPYLEFSIDWTNSYATKNSQRLKDETFQTIQCVQVTTTRDSDTNQTVTAQLTIIETQLGNTPDFEVFDTLYLQLVVTDLNNEVADKATDTARIVISILDINDNAPVFPTDTETVKRSVTENAPDGTVIPSPIATDADVGVLLVYSIQSADSLTPDWVTIENTTGIITVSIPDGESLDCDEPVRDSLWYNVTVSDGDHETTVTITVDINDQNDRIPTMDNTGVSIPESPNGDTSSNGNIVLTLTPTDADRDDPFNRVTCSFAAATGAEVTSRFRITDNAIAIQLDEGVNLDREESAEYVFDLTCYDDPIHQGPVSNPISPPPKITITLTDINDNAPTITDQAISLYENSPKGTVVSLEGKDLDEGDNENINFLEVKEIKRFINQGDPTPVEPPPPQDLFSVTTGQDNQGTLTQDADSLKDYYGYLVLTISLTDLGTPPQLNEVDVTIEVRKYNFEQPKFSFPDSDTPTQYLHTTQAVDSQLVLFNGETPLSNIKASDQQDNKFGVLFTLLDNDDVFAIKSLTNSEAQLQLKSDTFSPKAYNLTIMAYNNAPEGTPGTGFNQNTTLRIDFFNQGTTDPIFTNREDSYTFAENLNGQTYQVENATYSKPDLPEGLPIYYLLAVGDSTIFNLDIDTGLLTLEQPLDFERVQSYDLVIQSSNSQSLKPNAADETKFNLHIEVEDVNDHAPTFEQDVYIATVLMINSGGRALVTQVIATDIDTTSQNQLQFEITKSTGYPDSLNSFSKPFEIGTDGNITQNFPTEQVLSGYFILEVTVHDESPDMNDVTEVRVYFVTEQHLVQFTFENEQEDVRNAASEIKEILDVQFNSSNLVATVEDPTLGQAVDGSPRTLSPIYFVNVQSNVPIDKTEIYKQVADVNTFRNLKQALLVIGISLLNFDATSTTTDNLEATLKAWLIGVSVVLGSLCAILLVAFILKTRALNQRINKLSNTKFGSQESGLNRTGVTAPTTNKHAVEGSNPVYNNDVDTKDIDRRTSVTSGDSDLIGVEDDEKFNYDSPYEKIIE